MDTTVLRDLLGMWAKHATPAEIMEGLDVLLTELKARGTECKMVIKYVSPGQGLGKEERKDERTVD